MFKSVLRAAPRRILPSRAVVNPGSARRALSTAPPSQKPRGWKSTTARWAIAAYGVYYYNTSNVFAEEPEAAIQRLDDSMRGIQDSKLETLDAIVEEKRRRQADETQAGERKSEHLLRTAVAGAEEADVIEGDDSMEGLEDEADQQGAFNPETGEINWDCPCLGGMAHGPCGEEFRAAFSCFVYSKEEPKGMECIEKFQGMQDCFRQHPEMYGSELEDDEDEVEEELRAREIASPSSASESIPPPSQKVTPPVEEKSQSIKVNSDAETQTRA